MITLSFKGGEKLFKALASKSTIGKPIENGLRKIVLYYDGLVKKATVVDTGRLRSSVTHELNATRASVGTNVKYAAFIEYGTQNMEPRHMEGARKVLGQGMFGYALGLLNEWMGKGDHDIHKDIDKEFK